MTRARALDALLLIAIAAAGAFVRFDRLGRPSLWLDEILDFDVATKLAHGPWWRWLVRAPSEHGPLFFATELAGRVAGAPEWSSRLAPALFGVATIVAAWLAARSLPAGTPPALRGAAPAFALLVAASPFAVYYSREARPYALLMLIATALLGVLVLPAGSRRYGARPALGDDSDRRVVNVAPALSRRSRAVDVAPASSRPGLAPTLSLLAAALYTSAGATPLLLACAITAAIAWSLSRDRFYAQVAIAAASAAALVPLVYCRRPAEIATSFGPLTPRFFPELLQAFSVSALDTAHLHRVAWVFFALAVIGAAALFRADRVAGTVVAGMAVLPVLISVGSLLALRHWYSPRYVAAALPPYLLLVAIGLITLLRREVLALAGAVVLAWFGWGALRSEPLRKLDWRGISASIRNHAREGDVVIATNDWTAICLDFYLRALPKRVRVVSARESVERAARIAAEHEAVWIASAGFHRSGDVISWACRYPVVLADPIESFRLHFAPDLRHLIHSRLTDADERALAARYPGQALTMSPDDDFFLSGGWYGAERNGAGWARWSGMASEVTLIGDAGNQRITFRALPIATPQSVALLLNGAPLATMAMPLEWREYALDVPAALWRTGENRLSFRFARAGIPGGRDTRSLSAMFDSIAVTTSPPGDPPPPEVTRYFRIDDPLPRATGEPTRFDHLNDAKVAALFGRLGIDPRRRKEVTIEQAADTFAVASACWSDEEFLRIAYPVLIGRPLDPFGERDFLRHLRRDPSRRHAVFGIVKSAEFRERLH